MRKPWLLSCLTLGLAVSGLAVAWSFAPGHQINYKTFQEIQVGMSRVEVERLLRRPPGDYALREVEPVMLT